jgi:hypothetical protein
METKLNIELGRELETDELKNVSGGADNSGGIRAAANAALTELGGIRAAANAALTELGGIQAAANAALNQLGIR